jgi:acyl-CoA synthetase (AMP-forming)/AMP-acid ligase II
MTLRARPGAGVAALAGLLARSGALRHPVLAWSAARDGLPGVIRLAAARHPRRVALRRDADTITASDLRHEMEARAAGLPSHGRVGVGSDGGIGFVVTLAAALSAGLDAVPLGPRLSEADVAGLGLDGVVAPLRAPELQNAAGGRGNVQLTRRNPGRLLLLTTGTTGIPVATTRGRLGMRALTQLADAERRTGLPGDGPLLLLAPPDHGHGLSALAGALLRGIPVVLASGLTPTEQAELVVRHSPASVSGVPVQLARLLDAGGLGAARVVVTGSSPLTADLRARLEATGATVHDGFGATATGTVAIDGSPLAGVRLRVTSAGDLEVRSPLGGRRWIRTGDRVEVRGRRVHPGGRTGPLVDSGGELVDPSRLHALLAAHPGVRSAVVEVVPDDLLGVVLHARVDADAALDAELRATIAARLSRAEHPRRLDFGFVGQTPPS